MTGHGGWPLSVFLTPDAEAVFRRHVLAAAGARRACPASTEVLTAVADAWKHRRVRNCSSQAREAGRATCGRTSAAGGEQGAASGELAAGLTEQPLEAAESALGQVVRSALRRVRPGAEVPARHPDRLLWPRCCCGPLVAENGTSAAAARNCCRWPRSRWIAWRPAGSTTTSAAASTATASMPGGWCRTSRRCSTTTPCWPAAIWMPGRPPPRATTGRCSARRWTTCCAT